MKEIETFLKFNLWFESGTNAIFVIGNEEFQKLSSWARNYNHERTCSLITIIASYLSQLCHRSIHALYLCVHMEFHSVVFIIS